MKIQWFENNIRIRIKPAELETLLRGESIREELQIPGCDCWSAEVLPRFPATGLSLAGGALRFSLSEQDLTKLGQPTIEGVYCNQAGVTYYIEKDFRCAHTRDAKAQSGSETFAPTEHFKKRKNVT
jgi:hypothetical protein